MSAVTSVDWISLAVIATSILLAAGLHHAMTAGARKRSRAYWNGVMAGEARFQSYLRRLKEQGYTDSQIVSHLEAIEVPLAGAGRKA